MKIIKRNGQEEDFSAEKIMRVIRLANNSVLGTDRIPSDEKIQEVFDFVMKSLSQFGTVSVETIQDKIRDAFMNFNYFEVANSFITFRENKKAQKKYTETEEKIMTTCDYTNEAVKQDNANKNPRVLSVQRDYIAGECCKSIGKKKLPKDIVEAHNKGLMHWHDMDYSPLQKMSNCCLVYMKDAFENGFELNGTPIHRTTKGFVTDCTLASQVAPQVSGQQYGGQTMSWAHIARSVNISRMRFINELLDEGELEDFFIIGPKYDMYEGDIDQYEVVSYNIDDISVDQVYAILANKIPENRLNKLKHRVEIRVNREIANGVKTFQYQVLTILCSNGQTPFISMSMNLEDCEGDKQWEEDTKKVFEEVLRQRIKGLPDRHGNLVPVVFPKLLYFLDENNYQEGTPNWYLTKLAAESAAKTMAPDFISSKVQKKVKHTNHSWPCMGCVSKDSIVRVIYEGTEMVIPFSNLYEMVKFALPEQDQFEEGNLNKFIDVSNINLKVFDSKIGDFTKVKKLIKNRSVEWYQVTLHDGHSLICTDNHPHTIEGKDEVYTKDLKLTDKLYVSKDNGIVPCEISAITKVKSHEDINSKVEFEILEE